MHVRGVELAVTITGQGLPFIWGHGLTSSRATEDEAGLFNWSGVAEVAQLIRYDARGHGASGASFATVDYQWSNLARDMTGIVDALGINDFVAGGASMGCVTALFAALVAPGRVAGLVLVIPPTGWETRAARAEIRETLASIVETQGLDALAERLQQQPQARFLAEEFPEEREIRLRHVVAMNERVVSCWFRGAAQSELPLPDKVKSLTMPALILAWTDDPGHPLSTAEVLDVLLPNSSLHIASSLAEIHTWPGLVRDFLEGI